jgi:hypothetical protein
MFCKIDMNTNERVNLRTREPDLLGKKKRLISEDSLAFHFWEISPGDQEWYDRTTRLSRMSG